MIKFTLQCENGHRFDSWFASSEAYDKLRAAGHATCEICGSSRIEKAMMAPSVKAGRDAEPAPLTGAATDAERAMKAWRKDVEANSEYVGLSFAAQARDMHDGVQPTRAIHGEAKPEDARKLLEDGVPVTPLPFVPNRKSN
ncbi:MAG: DUF1178 family protein [Pseudomonadota bacterium]